MNPVAKALLSALFPLFMFLLMTPLSAEATNTTKKTNNNAKCVILLHGLARTHKSMNKLETKLLKSGYHVINVRYPSRLGNINTLSSVVMPKALNACGPSQSIDIITHSIGGILVRDFYANNPKIPRPRSVVMLAPPNHGTPIVDDPIYTHFGQWWYGPASAQLSASPNSYVNRLPAADFIVGVIAGNASINPIFSAKLPGADDGVISVASTHLEGMTDWLLLNATHSFMPDFEEVIYQALYFLKYEHFDK